MAAQIDLSSLLSPDNASRNAAEQALDHMQQSAPGQLAMQLVDSLADHAANPVVRELCAVLLRRRLPVMLPALGEEWREAVKGKMLQALSSECEARLRRKLCDAVGRLGCESLADNSWPQLMQFVHAACNSGVPTAHEAALMVLSHMAPGLVDPPIWATAGPSIQPILLGALGPAQSDGVSGAALCALAGLLSACAEQEKEASTPAERKKLRAVASDLQAALPAMLSVLEAAVGSSDASRLTGALESLGEIAASQPRLFKGVLPVLTEGMAQLAGTPTLPLDARIQCVELLLTLAEGAPKTCAKVPTFPARVLGALLPMLVRLEGDLETWEDAEPEDGLLDSDGDDDDEKEAAYAAEALERLCEALGGDSITTLLLPQLQPMFGEGAAWQSKHAGLVAIATVCESSVTVLEPHLDAILELVVRSSGASESRVRWASCFCLGLLCDEFGAIGESKHDAMVPMLTRAMADASSRVRAAASLAVCNLVNTMEEVAVLTHLEALLGGLHAIISSSASAGYAVYAAAATLAVLCDAVADAPSRPIAAAYSAFMPHLAQRIEPALAQRYGKLAAELLHSMGKLAAAAGAEAVAADAAGLVSSVVSLLERKEVTEDRNLLRGVHTTLTSLAALAGSSFVSRLEALLPALLQAAAVEVDFQLDMVEEIDEAADEKDDGWEVQYHQNKGKGFIKLRVNAAQMDEKLLALEALYSYADALGAAFHPAVKAVAQTCVPLLTYRWSDKVRGSAANALVVSYRCLVHAGAANVDGLSLAHAVEFGGALLKPLGDQLAKEDSLEASDAMLDAFREVLVLERTHSAGALNQQSLNGIIQMVKRQLQLDETRRRARAASSAEHEDEDEAEEDEEEEEAEAELLTTCTAITIEVLRQHGVNALPQVEAHLLPHFQPWLNCANPDGEGGGALVRLALGIDVIGGAIEHTSKEVAKKYVAAALPLLNAHASASDCRLRRAAMRALGAVAEHGGKQLTRPACAEMARSMVAVLSSPSARYSANLEASEAAALALGKMLVHRASSVDSAAVLPVWLAWLPLRRSEDDDARAAIACLCKLLEDDANAVFGGDGTGLPMVLAALAASYGSDATGEEVSARMKSLVVGWNTSNQAMLHSGAATLPQAHLREKIGRMATA